MCAAHVANSVVTDSEIPARTFSVTSEPYGLVSLVEGRLPGQHEGQLKPGERDYPLVAGFLVALRVRARTAAVITLVPGLSWDTGSGR
jgi:hypothetical protein